MACIRDGIVLNGCQTPGIYPVCCVTSAIKFIYSSTQSQPAFEKSSAIPLATRVLQVREGLAQQLLAIHVNCLAMLAVVTRHYEFVLQCTPLSSLQFVREMVELTCLAGELSKIFIPLLLIFYLRRNTSSWLR